VLFVGNLIHELIVEILLFEEDAELCLVEVGRLVD
jgi:hypothetical protein